MDDAKNYRPMSLVPILAKTFKIMLKTTLGYLLENNKILKNFQLGYKTGQSTITVLCDAYEYIVDALENQCCSAKFSSLSQALGIVNHSRLVEKLEYYGLNEFVQNVS